MKTPNQIAAEAAREICGKFGMTYPSVGYLGADHWDDVTAIILAAIEEGYRMGKQDQLAYDKTVDEMLESRAAQATPTQASKDYTVGEGSTAQASEAPVQQSPSGALMYEGKTVSSSTDS